MPSPEILSPSLAVRFFSTYFSTLLDVWGRNLDRTWEEMKANFPNPILMGLTAVSFILDIPFQPLRAVIENIGRVMLPNARFYRRFVVTGEECFKLNVEFITAGGLRAGLIDQSLVDMLFSWLAARMFVWISGGGLIARIRKLMGITSVDDVLRIVKGSITRAVALRAIELMMAFFSIGYAAVSLVNLGLTWNEKFEGLQQRNPRERGVQRNRVRTSTRTLPTRSKRAVSSFQSV